MTAGTRGRVFGLTSCSVGLEVARMTRQVSSLCWDVVLKCPGSGEHAQGAVMEDMAS